MIRSLDDLKERLAKVVFLILIVRFFEFALRSQIRSPPDVLDLAIGIALVALALYLTGHRVREDLDGAGETERRGPVPPACRARCC